MFFFFTIAFYFSFFIFIVIQLQLYNMLTGDYNIWVKEPSRCEVPKGRCFQVRISLKKLQTCSAQKEQFVKIQMYGPHPHRSWINRSKVEPVNLHIHQGPGWCSHCRSRDLLLVARSRSFPKSSFCSLSKRISNHFLFPFHVLVVPLSSISLSQQLCCCLPPGLPICCSLTLQHFSPHSTVLG